MSSGWWVFAVCALSAQWAFADGLNGTEYGGDVSEAFVRLGPSSLASAQESHFTLQSRWNGIQTISEIRFYVDAVHQPGPVVLTSSLGASATAMVTTPGWVAFSFGPVPLSLTVQMVIGLTLMPQGSTELTLRHVSHRIEANHQIGGSRGPLLTIIEPSRAAPYFWNVSAVVRLVGDEDPFASPTCGPGDRDPVAGFPYVRVWQATVNGGGRRQQFQYPNLSPWGVDTARFVVGSVFLDGGAVSGLEYVFRRLDGGVIGRGPPSVPDGVVLSDSPVLDVVDAGVSETFEVELSSDGGGAWLVVDTGSELLDPCDPAVRATFGGHHSRALDLPPGADYMLRLGGQLARTLYADSDGDGFGTGAQVWVRGFPLSGYSRHGGDCDDTRADVRPDAGETCNGIDDDCNGLIDASDALDPSLCANQSGVCRSSTRLCVGGVVLACDASRYGPSFHEETCDGLDNDCDGQVDDGARGPCAEQRGVCQGSTMECSSTPLQCAATEYGPDYEVTESRCDGLDNDCDGLVDASDPDVAPRLCELQAGVCTGTRSSCNPNGWSDCAREYSGAYEATEATRDGLDNDCDGEIDEGLPLPEPMTVRPKGCGCSGAGESLLVLVNGLVLTRRKRRSHSQSARRG